MDSLLQDLRQALRMLRDQPAFAVTAVLALALGIGVNFGVFTVVNAVLLRPLPYPEPERLVAPLQIDNGAPAAIFATPAHVTHWRSLDDVFEDVVAWRTESFDFTTGDTPATVTAGTVSDGYFRTLGATFAAGRALAADEHTAGGPSAVVISHGFWTRALGARPSALGSTLVLSGAPHTIVGITSDAFDVRGIDTRGFGVPEIWVPLHVDPNLTDFSVTLDAFARLRDGVSLAAAQQRLAGSLAAYRERFPADTQSWQFTALGMQETVAAKARPLLLTLTGAVALVLLVACANVANLLLVRGAGRGREIAVRATLGAGRARIVRQLLTESAVLTAIGGALGLLLGIVGVRALLASGLVDLPRLGGTAVALALDWRVAAFALLVSLATCLVFGLVPALVGARVDLSSVMKDATSRAAGGRRRTRAQTVLVVAEVALAVVLVVGAGLTIRTALAIGAVDLGFDTSGVLTLRVPPDPTRPPAVLAAANERALARIRALPGVEAAAASLGMLLADGMFAPFDIVGRQSSGAATGAAHTVPSSVDYFSTLGIPVLRGRAFDDGDARGTAPVVVINEALARRYWKDGRDPLNDTIKVGGTAIPEAADEPARQIVGIVGNVRHQGLFDGAAAPPALYLPHAQLSDGLGRVAVLPMGFIVRTSVPPQSVAAAVQRSLREETGRAVGDVRVLERTWLESTSRQRLSLWLMTLFGAAALLLGAVGIYGLVAYTVQARRHEIGIRLAVGARPAAVRNMVIREGSVRVAAGIVVGLAAAYFSAKLLESLLFGVEPHDIVVFTTVPLVLAAVGLAAVCVPALRATRVDPTSALRSA